MSSTNTPLVKRSFKIIEIPLNKFKYEAIPHHQELILKHKANIYKLTSTGDYGQLDREIRDTQRIVRQLRELMYELDTLRTQVEDYDLDKFDSKTLPLRKIILELVNNYLDLETKNRKTIEEYIGNKHTNLEQDTSYIQIQDNIEASQLQKNENQLKRIEALNSDIEGVHDIFCNLNQMVNTQKEQINNVELNIEVTDTEVKSSLFQLIKTAKLQKASYPVAGAFIGTLVGGPIGSVAGLKIGGLVAIGCGIAGYVGGKFFRKINNDELLQTELELKETHSVENVSSNGVAITTANDKKYI